MTASALPPIGATGIGSLPGEDIDAALALALDATPDLPWLPELPARGPGSDMIGRTLAAVHAATGDFAFDLQPAGWRLVSRPGLDARRALDRLVGDVDALLPFGDLDGNFKTQLAGPWTLAANIDLNRGGRALRDAGAVRELTAALAEAAAARLAAIRERAPRASLVLQYDEPSVAAVRAGSLPTESGFGRIPGVPDPDLVAGLQVAIDGAAVDGAAVPVAVHCCAGNPPLALLADAGAAAVSWDATGLVAGGRLDEDTLGALVERDVRLWLGVLPALGPGVPPRPGSVADPVRRLWRSLGFPPERLPATVTLTPACGLAGASQGWAREVFRVLRQAASALSEAPEKIGS